jgi:WD40 repeat protein
MDGAVRPWNVDRKENVLTFRGHSQHFVTSAVWSPDGRRIASKDWHGQVIIWQASSGLILLKLQCPGGGTSTGKAYDVGWSPDGTKLAAGCGDGTVIVWDAKTGRELHALKGHTSVVRSLQWSPDARRLVSGAEDRTVRVWDPESGRELLVVTGLPNAFPAVAWSPDCRRIGAAQYSTIILDAAVGYESAGELSARPE